jgi:putative ABC transport system permease protein
MSPGRAERVYRALLLLYPRGFRRAYGEDLVAAFAQRYRTRGRRRVRFWAFHLADLIRSVPREHWNALRSRPPDVSAAPRGAAAPAGAHMHVMIQDVHHALRGFRRQPAFPAVVILTLALGIGMNTAIFSLVNGVLLTPLPFDGADRLVWGYSTFSRGDYAAVSPPDFLDYRDQTTVFEHLAARQGADSYTLTGLEKPERIRGQYVSAGFFEALGAVPVLGRTFEREDESREASRVVVISHGFWQRRFGGGAGVVGQRITLDDEPYEIIGVAPRAFQLFDAVDFWKPIPFDDDFYGVRRFHMLRLVGRLAPGVTLERAQADLDIISRRLEEAYPESNDTWRLVVVPLHQIAVGDVRPALLVLLAAVGLVLLIACGNVANLLLARGATRESEMAVRSALGASRGRLVRHLLTESLVLAVAGGALGTVLAEVSVRVLNATALEELPKLFEVAVDTRVLLFALGLSVVTGLVFGLLPSLAVSKPDVNAAIKQVGRSGGAAGGTTRAVLVAAEVGLSAMLLIGAGLLIQSFWRLNRVDPGFDAQNALTFRVSLPSARYDSRRKRNAFLDRATEQLKAMPGVEDVAVTSMLPLSGSGSDTYVAVLGRHQLGTDTQFNAQVRTISANYFDVMGMPLLRGRAFTGAEGPEGPNVVIINEPFATNIFPDEDPVGQRLVIDLGDPHEAEIIGVVAGVHHFGLSNPRPPAFYLPRAQVFPPENFVLRTSVDPLSLSGAVQEAVASVDPDQPVSGMASYADVVAESLAPALFQTVLLGLFAAVALLLAALGIYGVIGYYVAQRVREVGIRMALGADKRHVYRLIVGRGVALSGLGLAAGLLGALGMTRFMSSLLYGIGATDPFTFAVVPLCLGAAALVASYLPARRAARVDPVTALRSAQYAAAAIRRSRRCSRGDIGHGIH